MKFDKTALIEALKELARVAILASIPVITSSINTITGEFNLDWRILFAAVVIAILKALDKYIHRNENTELKGMLPF